MALKLAVLTGFLVDLFVADAQDLGVILEADVLGIAPQLVIREAQAEGIQEREEGESQDPDDAGHQKQVIWRGCFSWSGSVAESHFRCVGDSQSRPYGLSIWIGGRLTESPLRPVHLDWRATQGVAHTDFVATSYMPP